MNWFPRLHFKAGPVLAYAPVASGAARYCLSLHSSCSKLFTSPLCQLCCSSDLELFCDSSVDTCLTEGVRSSSKHTLIFEADLSREPLPSSVYAHQVRCSLVFWLFGP